jgi:cytochrome b subunit of formate dehydrogenase
MYGLGVGLFFGLFLGWMFHGFVGALVRTLIVLIILVPLALAIAFCFKVNQQNQAERSDIQDAEWRDVPPRR